MNNKVQKATVAIVAIVVFLATFFGSTREQVVVEAKKIVTDSNNINNDYLIGIQSLENALGAKGLVILDIRSSKEYDKGHIPGAINVSWSQFIDKNTQSDNTQSNNAQSNNTQSNNTQSNNAQSDNAQSDNTQSNNTQSDNTESNNTQSDNTESNNAQSNNTQSNNTQSNNVQSDNTQSNNAQNNNDNISNDTTNWTNLINKKVLTNELQSLGINKDSTVVIYGDSNGDDLGELGKFSWMFRMVGLQSKMLNGGYKNWKSQGFKTTTVVPSITKSDMEIKSFTPIKAIKTDDLEKNISKIKILELVNDVKENQENLTNTANNENNTQNTKNNNEQKIANKIDNNVQLKTNEQDTEVDPPVEGVIQIKLSDMLNPNGTIKPVSQLQQLFNSKGISKDDVLLFYNTDKGNLAFLTLMLNMSGYTNIETYNASLTQVAQITTQILNTKNENENDKNSTQGKSTKVNNISTQGNTSNNTQNNNNNSNSNSSNNGSASGNGNSTNINSSNQNTNN